MKMGVFKRSAHLQMKMKTYSPPMSLHHVLLLIFFGTFSITSFGQIELPNLISNGMVLQRDSNVKLWGWASVEEPVSITFQGKEYSTLADSDGNWSVSLNNLKQGGPFTMAINGKNKLELTDIYIGDVWLASGQSNMEISMGRVEPLYPDEIEKALNPEIRFFEVPKTFHFEEPLEKLEGGAWKAVTPENIRQFSAVAYFFSKDLYERYGIPIGIINSSLGGSPAEAWLSEQSLKQFPEHYSEAKKFQRTQFRDSIQEDDSKRIGNWHQKAAQEDLGIIDNWKDENLNTNDWYSMEIPGYWADNDFGSRNGVVWFRKTIEIPEALAEESPLLLMGRIVDADSVFVNGKFVGNTTYQYPPRRYEVPAEVLRAGKNTITVRITNESGRGGFVEDKPYKLIFRDTEYDLSGEWRYKLGVEMPSLRGQTFIRWKPMGLFNAMINPITNYSIKGVIWYQGESNAGRPGEYKDLFSSLIKDWRKHWGQEDLPFLYVQLSNFMESKSEPGDSNWARLREAQLKTLSLPNTGMAVAIDVGEWNDIHPLNKKAVGKRLAQAARNVAYKEDVIKGGPIYESFEQQGDSIVISFQNTGKGLVVNNGDKLQQFAIAGKDGNFVWANAEIKNDKVIVYSPEVKNPVAVRYAWADNPEGANLFNLDGFPASPFRTDDY